MFYPPHRITPEHSGEAHEIPIPPGAKAPSATLDLA